MYFYNPFESMNHRHKCYERSEHIHYDPYDPKFYLPHALSYIIVLVKDETKDQLRYEKLGSLAKCQDDKDIILGMVKDEIKHIKLLKQIHHELTQRTIISKQEYSNNNNLSLCDGLKEALMHEQKEVELYRRVFFGMEERRHINMLLEIITDEMRHFGLCQYLYVKNMG